jgi:nitrite reductase (NO-forming)
LENSFWPFKCINPELNRPIIHFFPILTHDIKNMGPNIEVCSETNPNQNLKNMKEGSKPRLGNYMIVLACTLFFAACSNGENTGIEKKFDASNMQVTGESKAELTAPPMVPAPVGSRGPTKLLVDMEILEQEGEMTDGVSYIYWTFGGSVPGSFIRTRVGDEVEFTLKNHPENKLPHNIDLHAVTGPGGGAASSFVAPGHEVTFSFKTLNPGLYVYHCATAPVGMHIANGMYGLILVEPAGGLPKVDKEYYIMQGDFYTKGENGQPGLQPFDMQKAVDEDADYVVFNGKVGALTGDDAITAKVGETVRLFVGNGGPNLVSSFHVIGEIFDKVNVEGGDFINENVQTTLVPAGGSAIVEFKVDVPGTFILVDHSIFRAFNKGALGMLKVEGEEDEIIYSGKQIEGIYNPEGGAIQEMPGDSPEALVAASIEDRIKFGKQIYSQTCFACHQAEGQGIPSAFPPLANSDYLNEDVDRAIEIVLKGKSGEITVNGEVYNSVMTAQTLTDEEVANVMTFIYNSWGNNATEVTPAMVAKVKGGH